ncbi:hypothetical protein CWI38_0497p0010, partial [Hamiltosporidium tvaerminnensis]
MVYLLISFFKPFSFLEDLHSVELRSEHMLLQLFDCLEKSKEISTRRAAIL